MEKTGFFFDLLFPRFHFFIHIVNQIRSGISFSGISGDGENNLFTGLVTNNAYPYWA